LCCFVAPAYTAAAALTDVDTFLAVVDLVADMLCPLSRGKHKRARDEAFPLSAVVREMISLIPLGEGCSQKKGIIKGVLDH
jgi:hypothetical protein